MNEEKQTYFQYFKEHGYPLTVGLNVAAHHKEVINSLELLGFTEMPKDDWVKLDQANKELTHVDIKKPSPMLVGGIGTLSSAGSLGKESLSSKNGYKIYKFHGRCQMDFSEKFQVWRMNLLCDTSEKTLRTDFCHIMNRIISWALMKENIVGFWGVPVEDGLIGMKASESASEAFFIDLDLSLIHI